MGHAQSSCCFQDYHKHSNIEEIETEASSLQDDSKTGWSKAVRFAADADQELSTEEGDSSPDDLESQCSSIDKDGHGKFQDRRQTFLLVNERTKSTMTMDEEEEGSDDDNDSLTKDKTMRQMLGQIRHLVDKAYDVLPAETLFADLEMMVAVEQWREIRNSELFARFCRKLAFFYDVGANCCHRQDGWVEVFNGENGTQILHCFIDKQDSRIVHYQARAEIPTSLKNVMAVANEITLMKHWNFLVCDEPQVIGRRTAHYMVSNYRLSALGGLYKVDVLNEARRFSDVHGGFVCEHISTPPADHPSYCEPKAGFKRVQSETKAIHLACGPERCLSISGGKIKLPFSAHKLPSKAVGQLAGRAIIGGLIQNAVRAGETNSPWNRLVEEDRFGLYDRVEECMRSEGSLSRIPGLGDKSSGEFDLEELFSRRRFYRPDSRTPEEGASSAEGRPAV